MKVTRSLPGSDCQKYKEPNSVFHLSTSDCCHPASQVIPWVININRKESDIRILLWATQNYSRHNPLTSDSLSDIHPVPPMESESDFPNTNKKGKWFAVSVHYFCTGVCLCVCDCVWYVSSVRLYLVAQAASVLVVRCLACDYNMLECLQKVTLLALSTCLQRSRQGHVGRTWRHFCSLSLSTLLAPSLTLNLGQDIR